MSKLEAIEAEVQKLPPEQAVQLQDWLANYLEDEAELNPEFVASIERGQADLREGHVRVRKTWRAVNQATEIYSREFDAIFFRLPPQVQGRIEARLRQMGWRLDDFPHARLQGRAEFRLRVGDYRIIYAVAVVRGGSYYFPQGSGGYFPNSSRLTEHGKLLLMVPCKDRAATLGFRCVMDAN